MCFYISLSMDPQDLKDRFGVEFIEPDEYRQFYWVSGFSHPEVPVITTEQPGRAAMYSWGLVPHWVKDGKQADEMRTKTLNARAESVFEKPSFSGSIGEKRCLVPVNGFFEWKHAGADKNPYFIHLVDKAPFALAGIWEHWEDRAAPGTVRKTFSIITTEANPLMAKIHNSTERMPVILPREAEERWIKKDLSADSIRELMAPLDESLMDAYPISRDFRSKSGPDALEIREYEESSQTKLF